MKFNPFGYDSFSEKGSFEDAFTSFMALSIIGLKRYEREMVGMAGVIDKVNFLK